MRWLKWPLWKHMLGSKPYVIGSGEKPYMLRWFVIPHNPLFNVFLHKFMKSDDDRSLHDHPWRFNVSVLLHGSYVEHTQKGSFVRKAPCIAFRKGAAPHRIQLMSALYTKEIMLNQFENRIEELPVWTLFITGPKFREWGFLCPKGWRHWREFTKETADGNAIGLGCE